MKKLKFEVQELCGSRTMNGSSPNNILTPMPKTMWTATGPATVGLFLPSPTVLTSVIIRNFASAFTRIRVGTEEEAELLSRSPASEQAAIIENLAVLVPLKQLTSVENLRSDNAKKNLKVVSYRNFPHFISNEASKWKVIVIECLPFPDIPFKRVGLIFVNVFGKPTDASATAQAEEEKARQKIADKTEETQTKFNDILASYIAKAAAKGSNSKRKGEGLSSGGGANAKRIKV